MHRTVFTAEHEAFRGRARAFVAEEVVPEYPDWERAGRPSRGFWRRAAEIGILDIGVPADLSSGPA